MKIRLTDISKDGRNYIFNRETADLNSVLSDLLQSEAYQIEFHIRPLNSKTFEMKGNFEACAPSVCSKCGDDFILKVKRNFHEILTPEQPSERTGRYSRTHVSDEEGGISNVEYASDMTFDVSEYFHEVIGIAIPAFPKHPEEEIQVCNAALDELGLGHLTAEKGVEYKEPDFEEKPNPFSTLKNLKLDLN